ncbi:MAG: hypothetical protein K0R12_1065 [Gammaproteobacteria bacterium]|jgi:hypothetical protein|nr:hypothetical protein [Gammaproteobacteria bacterium]
MDKRFIKWLIDRKLLCRIPTAAALPSPALLMQLALSHVSGRGRREAAGEGSAQQGFYSDSSK